MRIEQIKCSPLPTTNIPRILDVTIKVMQYKDDITSPELDMRTIENSLPIFGNLEYNDIFRALRINLNYPVEKVKGDNKPLVTELLTKKEDGYYKGNISLYDAHSIDKNIIPAILHNKEKKYGFWWEPEKDLYVFLLTLPYYQHLQVSKDAILEGCPYFSSSIPKIANVVRSTTYHSDTRMVVPSELESYIPWGGSPLLQSKIEFLRGKWVITRKDGIDKVDFIQMRESGIELDALLHTNMILEKNFKAFGEFFTPPHLGIDAVLIGTKDNLLNLLAKSRVFKYNMNLRHSIFSTLNPSTSKRAIKSSFLYDRIFN